MPPQPLEPLGQLSPHGHTAGGGIAVARVAAGDGGHQRRGGAKGGGVDQERDRRGGRKQQPAGGWAGQLPADQRGALDAAVGPLQAGRVAGD
jgi:hypothetical protein